LLPLRRNSWKVAGTRPQNWENRSLEEKKILPAPMCLLKDAQKKKKNQDGGGVGKMTIREGLLLLKTFNPLGRGRAPEKKDAAS